MDNVNESEKRVRVLGEFNAMVNKQRGLLENVSFLNNGPVYDQWVEDVEFVRPIYGFPREKVFRLFASREDRTESRILLTNVSHGVQFLTMNTLHIMPGYDPQLPPADDEGWDRMDGCHDLLILAILNVVGMTTTGGNWVANLKAPIIINQKSRLAFQWIVPGNKYHVQHPLAV